MIRLLPKSEINKLKSEEVQRERVEGMRLAKSVDSLREIRAQEEAALSKFRIETLSNMHKETTVESEKLGALKKKVSELETRKQEALVPLEKAWDEVKSKEVYLLSYASELNDKFLTLQTFDQKLSLEKDVIEKERSRIKQEREDSIRNLSQSEETKLQAKRLFSQVETRVVKSEQELAGQYAEMRLKENQLLDKEKDVEKTRLAQVKRAKELNDLEKLLTNRYRILQRQITNLQ